MVGDKSELFGFGGSTWSLWGNLHKNIYNVLIVLFNFFKVFRLSDGRHSLCNGARVLQFLFLCSTFHLGSVLVSHPTCRVLGSSSIVGCATSSFSLHLRAANDTRAQSPELRARPTDDRPSPRRSATSAPAFCFLVLLFVYSIHSHLV